MARLALLMVLVVACGRDGRPRIRLATTTSTENSGLIAYLLEEFNGFEVQVIAVGTGQALELGKRGDADLVLVHARAREDAFMKAGHGLERRDVMWNDFVILGPPADLAGVKGLKSAREAMKKIAAAKARFVSRGDDSGTHIRELSLWDPPRGREYYLEAGQGMGNCLTIADERQAYILADRGTFLAFRRKLDLIVLVEGDPALRNPYGAILIRPEAKSLFDFLVAPGTQERIAAFRVKGHVLFHPTADSG